MSKKVDENQLVSVSLTKKQWTVLFNLIVSQQYRFGVAIFLKEIVDAIEPHVVFDTNIEKKQEEPSNVTHS